MPLTPAYVANVSIGKGAPPLELSNAACGTPAGIAIMDGYVDAAKGDRGPGKELARKLCRGCPVRDACHAWVTRAENPPGSWHGMYAGRTPAERRSAAVSA